MLTSEIIRAFSGEMTPKFLATASADGVPNVVPIISLAAADDKTLIFGEFMIWKTRRNLMANPKVTALVVTESLEAWAIRGKFKGFEETGPAVERLNESKMFRYNAYLGIRRAGVIEVEEIACHSRLSKAALLMGYGAATLAAKVQSSGRPAAGAAQVAMPPNVEEKFGRLKSVRVISGLGPGGYPEAILAMTLRPAGPRSLVLTAGAPLDDRLAAIPQGAPVAASVITFDPIAYQVKGTWSGLHSFMGFKTGRIDLTEVYSACPPRPGARIA